MILRRYEHLAFNYKYKYLQESLLAYVCRWRSWRQEVLYWSVWGGSKRPSWYPHCVSTLYRSPTEWVTSSPGTSSTETWPVEMSCWLPHKRYSKHKSSNWYCSDIWFQGCSMSCWFIFISGNFIRIKICELELCIYRRWRLVTLDWWELCLVKKTTTPCQNKRRSHLLGIYYFTMHVFIIAYL